LSGASVKPGATQRALEHYARSYAEHAPGARDAPWLRRLRDEAIARFGELGFPTTRLEEWKYTRTQAFEKTLFEPWADGAEREITREGVEALAFPLFACSVYVFVDGRFAEALSAPRSLSGDLHVRSIARVRAEEPAALEPRLGALAAVKEDAFTALNTAFFEDGAFVHLPRGEHTQQPIHLVFVNTRTDTPRMAHPRVLVDAEEGSRATLIVDHVALEANEGVQRFTNAIVEARVGANARLDCVLLQRECDDTLHVSRTHVHQARDSRFASHSLTLGGAFVRNDLAVELADEGADCTMNGLFLGLGRRHVDNHTLVEHAMPHGTSRELYKGILADRSRGVFRGRVIVHPGAQKTSAQQSNPNMLLSDDAEIDTKPQLEIHADDVRCSHGSTIGQLDAAALFYLRSRGIDESAARRMLVQAFAAEVTGALPDEALGQSVRDMIVERLAGREARQ